MDIASGMKITPDDCLFRIGDAARSRGFRCTEVLPLGLFRFFRFVVSARSTIHSALDRLIGFPNFESHSLFGFTFRPPFLALCGLGFVPLSSFFPCARRHWASTLPLVHYRPRDCFRKKLGFKLDICPLSRRFS